MVKVRIEHLPSFHAVGRSTRISGQNNEDFGSFWAESHENGLIQSLHDLMKNEPGAITNSLIFGISCVEKDPSNRAFDFYIAAENGEKAADQSLSLLTIPEATWAIFENQGQMPEALIEVEMFAFMQWLPASVYQHANAPELEVYPVRDKNLVEFWLPVKE